MKIRKIYTVSQTTKLMIKVTDKKTLKIFQKLYFLNLNEKN